MPNTTHRFHIKLEGILPAGLAAHSGAQRLLILGSSRRDPRRDGLA
jgi:hypothetical protein